MGFAPLVVLAALALFGCMLLMVELGRRIAARRIVRDPETAQKGLGPFEGAVFGLLGLVLAFTFSGAGTRLDARRHLVGEEANAIGTAWSRIDLLPPVARAEARDRMRLYLDTRIAVYRDPEDRNATRDRVVRATALQREIWDLAVAGCLRPDAPPQAAILLLPALNAMIDITTTRAVATLTHPPRAVYLLLCVLALLASLLAGHAMAWNRGRSRLHVLVFAGMISVVFLVILDMEYPRFGFIRVEGVDRVLVELRASFR